MDWEERLDAEGISACPCCQMLFSHLEENGFCYECNDLGCEEEMKQYYNQKAEEDNGTT